MGHLFTSFQAIILVITLAAFSPEAVTGQSCQCPDEHCCSTYGPITPPGTSAPGTTNTGMVAAIVTKDFYHGIINKTGRGCAGTGFYTYSSFQDAAASYPSFGNDATNDVDNKREIAAFFAHATHETRHFCDIEEISGASKNYCGDSNTEYPCVAGKRYHGRGPLKLSWDFNYGPAGESIGFDGLGSPELASKDPTVSFKAALWFWMKNAHFRMISGQGFGATIRAITGDLECNGKNHDAMLDRVGYYVEYCKWLGVAPGDKLMTC